MIRPFLLISAVSLSAIAAASAQTPPLSMRTPAEVGRLPASSNSPYNASTAKDFAQACKQDQSSCSSMVGQVLMDRIQFSPTSHICLPGVSYASAVGPWLDAHPEAATMSARDGIYLAITTIYRCGPPNNY
jgi:hypothetical protein